MLKMEQYILSAGIYLAGTGTGRISQDLNHEPSNLVLLVVDQSKHQIRGEEDNIQQRANRKGCGFSPMSLSLSF